MGQDFAAECRKIERPPPPLWMFWQLGSGRVCEYQGVLKNRRSRFSIVDKLIMVYYDIANQDQKSVKWTIGQNIAVSTLS